MAAFDSDAFDTTAFDENAFDFSAAAAAVQIHFATTAFPWFFFGD